MVTSMGRRPSPTRTRPTQEGFHGFPVSTWLALPLGIGLAAIGSGIGLGGIGIGAMQAIGRQPEADG